MLNAPTRASIVEWPNLRSSKRVLRNTASGVADTLDQMNAVAGMVGKRLTYRELPEELTFVLIAFLIEGAHVRLWGILWNVPLDKSDFEMLAPTWHRLGSMGTGRSRPWIEAGRDQPFKSASAKPLTNPGCSLHHFVRERIRHKSAPGHPQLQTQEAVRGWQVLIAAGLGGPENLPVRVYVCCPVLLTSCGMRIHEFSIIEAQWDLVATPLIVVGTIESLHEGGLEHHQTPRTQSSGR